MTLCFVCLILSLGFLILIFICDASGCHISKYSWNISGGPCHWDVVTRQNYYSLWPTTSLFGFHWEVEPWGSIQTPAGVRVSMPVLIYQAESALQLPLAPTGGPWPCTQGPRSSARRPPVCGREVLVRYMFQLPGKNCRLSRSYLVLCCWFIRGWWVFLQLSVVNSGAVYVWYKENVVPLTKCFCKNTVLYSLPCAVNTKQSLLINWHQSKVVRARHWSNSGSC